MTGAEASGMGKLVVVCKIPETEAHKIGAMLVSQRLGVVIFDHIGCF
jgi:hypothetical protein